MPRFVIQKHAARNLHYDFRLEVAGAFASWAVPKGPSTDPRDKRLAMRVEDHRLSWGDFEGVIPDGQYGAGSVIVWDAGGYRNLSDERIEDALGAGHASFWLEGRKLRGGWSLRRIRASASGGKESWLLVKKRDEQADARRNPVSTQPESVLSGKTIDEVGPQA